MLRLVIPRQRHALFNVVRRAATTDSTQPITPKPPGPEPRSEIPKPPILPTTERSSPSPNAAATPIVPRVPIAAAPPPPTPAPARASPPPPPPPLPPAATKPPKPKRRFRRFIVYPAALLGLSFAGGVYYSLVSDNFHDFFTEYIPFGEDAVLYFEEQEFRRRYPNTPAPESKLYPQTSGEHKVKVAGKSGVSAKVTETDKKASEKDFKAQPTKNDTLGSTDRAVAASSQELAAGNTKQQEKPKPKPEPKVDPKPAKKEPEPKPQAQKAAPAPAPSPPAPSVAQLDALAIDNAADPVVQNVTKILNDVIAVVNADNAAGKYGSTIGKAKDEVKKLAGDINMYRAQESKAADEKIRQSQVEFDEGAQNLIKRIEKERRDQALQFREEYESERERLAKTYDDKLKAEIQAVQKIAEQRLHNELLDQNAKLTDSFTGSVKDRVEKERSARLSRLNELASSVANLEQLTSNWGKTLEANVKTQHLIVAVEAVRATLEQADRPKPFVHELVALKEIGSDNSLVNAAIASIHPSAYQKGVPTPAQLIDRFRRVASEVRKASLLPEDAGAASHAASLMLSKVMFRKQGLAVGEDVESILTRTETYLEEGNLDEATREMNGLEGWAKVLSKDWLLDCRKALEVRQALDVSSTALMLVIEPRMIVWDVC